MKWYYDKKDLKTTPSIKIDGIDYQTECRYRKEGARFIVQLGATLQLGHNTVATGVVYFHRFYMFHSFKTFPRYVTACCCLFLAGKVEETPKKCKDIIKVARSSLTDDKFVSFGEDPKEEVMTLERILLQTIKFDLQIEHPYTFLVKYAKCLKGDNAKLQKMVQMAWNFVNDSLSTTVCLQWEPEIIAVALIYLASKLSKFTVSDWVGRKPEHNKWWDMFVQDVTMEILEDICHQVLDLYQQPNESNTNSPPQAPPSKASPPSKRSNLSSPSTSAKSSPAIGNAAAPIPKIMSAHPIVASDLSAVPPSQADQYYGYPAYAYPPPSSGVIAPLPRPQLPPPPQPASISTTRSSTNNQNYPPHYPSAKYF